MTELAAIFHWSLADMEAMDGADLIVWAQRAVAWHNRVHGDGLK